MGAELRGVLPQAKECLGPPGSWERQRGVLFQNLLQKHGPANTLFRVGGLWNCERLRFCSCKLSIWC